MRSRTTWSGTAPATAARSSRWWSRWAGRRCAPRPISEANDMAGTINLKDAAEHALEAMRRQGFEQVQVGVALARQDELNVNHNEPSLLRSTETQKLSLLGLVDGRKASTELTNLDEESLRSTV